LAGGSALVSDVDNTLLGDDEALARFAEWYESRRGSMRLVYNSGRFYSSVVASIDSTALPEPDAVIGGVGTEIRFYPDGRSLEAWPAQFAGYEASAVRECLARFAELAPQPLELQSRWKTSYFVDGAPPEFLARLKRRLQAEGLAVELIYSSRRDLDVLPAAANKGSAAAFLAEHWNLAREKVMASGDSGNDLALFQQGFRGIVVANAHAELKALRGENVYHSPHAHAAGVLDGLEYWLARAQATV
jgi:mannosylfructose-6-phosphate phosphatase